MPTLSDTCDTDPDIIAAKEAYDAADAALVEFNKQHKASEYRFLAAEAQGWRKCHLDKLTVDFDRARDRFLRLLNQAANARFGKATEKHEITNPKLKPEPNWLREVAHAGEC